MAAISVIVPVYKAENDLDKCLQSILSQTYDDFEVILVDDGSPDRSGEICDKWAQEDNRVVVIHKENGGVSSARNVGLAKAKGEYVCFCDADDALSEDALYKLLVAMQESRSQLVVGDFTYVYTHRKKEDVYSTRRSNREYRVTSLNNSDELYAFWTSNNMLSVWGKLFVREIIWGNQLRFDEKMIVMEDYAFLIDYTAKCTQLCMIPDSIYLYTITEGTIESKRARLDFFDDVLIASEKLDQFCSLVSPAYAEKYQQETIYPTLKLAYEFLWSTKVNGNCDRIKKYKRIARATKNKTAQKMFLYYKDHYGRMEYYFIRRKNIVGILVAHRLQRMMRALP